MIPLQIWERSKTEKQELNFSGLREIVTGQDSSWIFEQKCPHRLWNIERILRHFVICDMELLSPQPYLEGRLHSDM